MNTERGTPVLSAGERGRTARRQVGIRPAAFLGLAVGLSYAGGAWLRLIHETAGMASPAGFAGMLRDPTLGLPVVALAVLLALAIVRRMPGIEHGGRLTLAIAGTSVALGASVADVVAGIGGASAAGAGRALHGTAAPAATFPVLDGILALGANSSSWGSYSSSSVA